jgi:hypothetical protein
MQGQPEGGNTERAGEPVGWDRIAAGELSPTEVRLAELMEEFRSRQRRRPDLVVRPWWIATAALTGRPRLGFVIEYCPTGRNSVEVVVRSDRVTIDGPTGALEAELDLGSGWLLDGSETGSPETLANHLLRLADRALDEAA